MMWLTVFGGSLCFRLPLFREERKGVNVHSSLGGTVAEHKQSIEDGNDGSNEDAGSDVGVGSWKEVVKQEIWEVRAWGWMVWGGCHPNVRVLGGQCCNISLHLHLLLLLHLLLITFLCTKVT